MQPDPGHCDERLSDHLIQGICHAVADLPGLTAPQRAEQTRIVSDAVRAYRPRDAVETMLAGHCVIYDHLLRDASRELSRPQPEETRRRTQAGLLAIGKVFLATFDRLRKRQHPAVARKTPTPTPAPSANSTKPAPQPAQAWPKAESQRSRLMGGSSHSTIPVDIPRSAVAVPA